MSTAKRASKRPPNLLDEPIEDEHDPERDRELEEDLVEITAPPPVKARKRLHKQPDLEDLTQEPPAKTRKLTKKQTTAEGWKTKVAALNKTLSKAPPPPKEKKPPGDEDVLLCLERIYGDIGPELKKLNTCLEISKACLEYFPPQGSENVMHSRRLLECVDSWLGIFQPCVTSELEDEYQLLIDEDPKNTTTDPNPLGVPGGGDPTFWFCFKHLLCCLLDKPAITGKPRISLMNISQDIRNQAKISYYSQLKHFLNEYVQILAELKWNQELCCQALKLLPAQQQTPKLRKNLQEYANILDLQVQQPLHNLKMQLDKGVGDNEIEILSSLKEQLGTWETLCWGKLRHESGILVHRGNNWVEKELFQPNKPHLQCASVKLCKLVQVVGLNHKMLSQPNKERTITVDASVTIASFKFHFDAEKSLDVFDTSLGSIRQTLCLKSEYMQLIDKICCLYEDDDLTPSEDAESLLPEEVPFDATHYDERPLSRSEFKEYANNRQSLPKGQLEYRSTGIYDQPKDLNVDDDGDLVQEVAEGFFIKVTNTIPVVSYSLRMPFRPAVADHEIEQALLLKYVCGWYDYKAVINPNNVGSFYNFRRGVMLRIDYLHQEPFIEFCESVKRENQKMGVQTLQWFCTVNTNWTNIQLEIHGFDKETFKQRVEDALAHVDYSYLDTYSISNILSWNLRYLNVEVGPESGRVHAHALLEVTFAFVDEQPENKPAQFKLAYPFLTGAIKQSFPNSYAQFIPVKRLINDDDTDREERIKKYCEKGIHDCSTEAIGRNKSTKIKRKSTYTKS
jgi:hypothetical protein